MHALAQYNIAPCVKKKNFHVLRAFFPSSLYRKTFNVINWRILLFYYYFPQTGFSFLSSAYNYESSVFMNAAIAMYITTIYYFMFYRMVWPVLWCSVIVLKPYAKKGFHKMSLQRDSLTRFFMLFIFTKHLLL